MSALILDSGIGSARIIQRLAVDALKFAATDATHGHVGAPVSVRRSNS